MRALRILRRRQQIATATGAREIRNNSLLSPCSLVTPSSIYASSSYFSSSSSTTASLSSHLPYWQKNLLILGGAGLLSSSYLYNSNNDQHTSQCETKTKAPKEISSQSDDTMVTSSTMTMTETTAVPSPSTDPNEGNQEDEETHCTICLINRQGPCRPHWRKFERCMKDHSKSSGIDKGKDNTGDENGNTNDASSGSSTMGDKCDGHMMPWITCVQSHRNTYTLISNKFFQDEFVDGVEKGIHVEDKVCLGGNKDTGDEPSSVPVDWKQFVEFPYYDWLQEDGEGSVEREEIGSEKKGVATGREEDADAILVEGVARINLWDGNGEGQNGGRRVDLAYVRDQDGLLLGHERFSMTNNTTVEREGDAPGKVVTSGDEKIDSSHEEYDTTDNNNAGSEPRIGHCTFHVSPETTKAIQIFALYGQDYDDHSDSDDIKVEEMKSDEVKDSVHSVAIEDEDKKRGKQTLYYSSLIPLSDLKAPDRIKDSSLPNDGKNKEETEKIFTDAAVQAK